MNGDNVQRIYRQFEILEADFEVTKITSGHINQTYQVVNNGRLHLVQQLNSTIFKNLAVITENCHEIANHLIQKKYPHPVLKPLRFQNGEFLAENEWRIFEFIPDTDSYEKVQSPQQAYEAAKFLSEFHLYLLDFDPKKIQPSIPGFLDFNWRWQEFQNALKSANEIRMQLALEEIEIIKENVSILHSWFKILPQLPQRVLHADPKISNFLCRKHHPNQILALIDWDTIMCGTILYDFGDMVRSYTNLKEEDDPDKGGNFSQENYDNLKKGFLFHLDKELLPVEIENFDLAAQTIVYVQAIRFLTDYLRGDIYYHIRYPEQNLNRTKNQLHVLNEMMEMN